MAFLTEMFLSDGELDVTVHWNGALTTVWVSDRVTGHTATGHAKHNPEDTYDPDFGYSLAHARAMNRLFKKVERTYRGG